MEKAVVVLHKVKLGCLYGKYNVVFQCLDSHIRASVSRPRILIFFMVHHIHSKQL